MGIFVGKILKALTQRHRDAEIFLLNTSLRPCVTFMDELMPWAHGCAGAASVSKIKSS